MAAKKANKIQMIKITAKNWMTALLILLVVGWIVSIPVVAEAIAPMIKMDVKKLIFYGEVVHTWGLSIFLFLLAFMVMGNPLFAILFALAAASVGYHAIRKFR